MTGTVWLPGNGVRLASIPAARARAATAAAAQALHSGEVVWFDNGFYVELTEGVRAATAAVRGAIENLLDYPDMPATDRERFAGIVRDEAVTLGERVDRLMRRSADDLIDRSQHEDMSAADLIAAGAQAVTAAGGPASPSSAAAAASRRRRARPTKPSPQKRPATGCGCRLDGYSAVRAIAALLTRLRTQYGLDEVMLRLEPEPGDPYAALTVRWHGIDVDAETPREWTAEPTAATGTDPIGDVLARHDAQVWSRAEPDDRAYLRMLLPLAPTRRESSHPRPYQRRRGRSCRRRGRSSTTSTYSEPPMPKRGGATGRLTRSRTRSSTPRQPACSRLKVMRSPRSVPCGLSTDDCSARRSSAGSSTLVGRRPRRPGQHRDQPGPPPRSPPWWWRPWWRSCGSWPTTSCIWRNGSARRWPGWVSAWPTAPRSWPWPRSPGGSGNFARAFGAELSAKLGGGATHWGDLWIYAVGRVVGGVVAVLIYDVLIAGRLLMAPATSRACTGRTAIASPA